MTTLVHPSATEFDLSDVLHALSDPVRRSIVRRLAREGEVPCGGFDLSDQQTRDYLISYFGNSSGTAAKSAGSYLLIDAGPDRIFGTNDDIVVGAGGGQ